MRLNRKKIIGSALAFAAAFMLSAAVFAQGGPGGPRGPHGPGFGGPGGPGGGILGHLSQALSLTDAQKAQIKQLEESFRDSTKGLHEQLRNAGPGDPFAAVSSGTFDEAAVRAAAQTRANIQVELEVAHAKFFSQVYSILTTEQKAKLAELRKQMDEHRHQGPPPPPPGDEDGGR